HRLSIEEIARAHDTTPNQVRLRLRAEGIRRPSGPALRRSPPRPPNKELVSLYSKQGVTLNELAARYHTSRQRVRDWLLEAGVAIAPRTTRATRLQLPTEEVATAYWDEGCSAAVIGERFGTTIDQVLRCLHDAGVPVRVGLGRPEAMCVLEQLYGDRQ